jgi:hypothetical protein
MQSETCGLWGAASPMGWRFPPDVDVPHPCLANVVKSCLRFAYRLARLMQSPLSNPDRNGEPSEIRIDSRIALSWSEFATSRRGFRSVRHESRDG